MKKVNTILSGDSCIAEGRQNFRRHGFFTGDISIEVISPVIVDIILDVHTAKDVGNCCRCPYHDNWQLTGCRLHKWSWQCVDEGLI